MFNRPIFLTEQYPKMIGPTLNEISSLIPDFAPIEKLEFDACQVEPFMARLRTMKGKNLIVTGVETHVCVLQTAIDLKEAGLNPVVVMDCVSSRTKENIEMAKERFRFEGIMMTSFESVLFELTRSSCVPVFKAISGLVK